MTEPYLILHRVRGLPAFDIAEKTMIGDEEGWIVSTSGWRAYPHSWIKLTDIKEIFEGNGHSTTVNAAMRLKLGDDLPDHFGANKSLHDPSPSAGLPLLERLGMVPKFNRRKFDNE